MKRAAIVLLAWGMWLGALTGVQAVFEPELIQFAMPAIAAAACICAGLALWSLEVYRGPEERPRLIADSSLATATLVLGVALALLGAGFGLWLILIGVGIGALGLGGIVREQRARARRLHRRSTR
jgi:hypothetical protein